VFVNWVTGNPTRFKILVAKHAFPMLAETEVVFVMFAADTGPPT
jgi:hypothetical protein